MIQRFQTSYILYDALNMISQDFPLFQKYCPGENDFTSWKSSLMFTYSHNKMGREIPTSDTLAELSSQVPNLTQSCLHHNWLWEGKEVEGMQGEDRQELV